MRTPIMMNHLRRLFLIAIMLSSGLGCDAAFTDLRPEALMSAPDGDRTDATVSTVDVGIDVPAPDLDPNFAPDLAVVEERVIATGMFVPRADYGGEGTATLVQVPDGTFEVRIGEDFSVGSVPGPTVVLAREDSLGSTLDVGRGDLELGVLESNSGGSTYPVPRDPGDRRFLWIYCKPFGLQMARAQLVDL